MELEIPLMHEKTESITNFLMNPIYLWIEGLRTCLVSQNQTSQNLWPLVMSCHP